MKKSSCGINGDGVLRGLRRSMVVFIGPCWCSSVHFHVCYGGYARHMLKLGYCF